MRWGCPRRARTPRVQLSGRGWVLRDLGGFCRWDRVWGAGSLSTPKLTVFVFFQDPSGFFFFFGGLLGGLGPPAARLELKALGNPPTPRQGRLPPAVPGQGEKRESREFGESARAAGTKGHPKDCQGACCLTPTDAPRLGVREGPGPAPTLGDGRG